MRNAVLRGLAGACLSVAAGTMSPVGAGPVFDHVFNPLDNYTPPIEQPYRASLCLNGRWQFQPVDLPADYQPNSGNPPDLPPPSADRWSSVPIKTPCPINVNAWGNGRDVGEGTRRPYVAGSVYYPSYPPAWDQAQMGWLRRTFRVPAGWDDRRIVLHFDAVAGDCQVLINGRAAGHHFDSFLPFDVDVTQYVSRDSDNELLVGVRASNLMNNRSPHYAKYTRPYPNGSNLDHLVGIWQDVTLVALPAIRVSNTFVEPMVDQDELRIDAAVRNDTASDQRVELRADVCPWINLAGKDMISAPESKWRLGDRVMDVPAQEVTVPAGGSVQVTLSARVSGRLALWTPDAPNLYGLVLTTSVAGRAADCSYTRFGWRQLKIDGSNLLLNGAKIQLVGDICHPFGPFMMSRRFAWAWFRMIKDFGGNAVRLHAQPYPHYFLDVADEMGIMVLDEDALFGSSISLNLEDPSAWPRFNQHFTDLILRDRNHPSVFGWSFGNEMFAVLRQASAQDQAQYRSELVALGKQAYGLDPTRQWISCDGDADLGGQLPTWSKHFGLGLHLDQLPQSSDKPLMVGESGGTYYARPSQMAVFNGDASYVSYAGRNDALGIDVYQNVVKMARPYLAYFSASETVWFGLEHLPYGYTDMSRLPNAADGVTFGPYAEGQPGMQLERIPPYVGTLNPGWDPSLPLYKPLGMFDAMAAANHKPAPLPCAWDRPIAPRVDPPAPAPAQQTLGFAGAPDSILARQLGVWGAALSAADDPAIATLLVDGQGLDRRSIDSVRACASAVLSRGGTVWIAVRDQTAPVDLINSLLPAPAALTPRQATMLVKRDSAVWTAPLTMRDLYFAEDNLDKYVEKCGIGGDFASHGAVLLEAGAVDWSLFVNTPEVAKCGAVVLYEHLNKPAGAALVEAPAGRGRIALSTIDYASPSSNYAALWRQMLMNAGIKIGPMRSGDGAVQSGNGPLGHDLLLNGPQQ